MGIKKYIFFLLCLFLHGLSSAQCAMCKAVVESEVENGTLRAEGINSGILYLMIFPYALLCVAGYFLYKNYKKNKATQYTIRSLNKN